MEAERYAILGDIHANWEALTAVLADAEAQGVTHFASVGDIIGYNPNPAACIDRLRELDCVCVRGNHDQYCAAPDRRQDLNQVAAAALAWTREQLSEERLAYLRALPYRADAAGFEIVHASLNAMEQYEYVFGVFEALESFSCQEAQVCFHGHTHVPIVFEEDHGIAVRRFDSVRVQPGRRYFINVGSVGQPRDSDPRAAYAVYDLAREEISLRRVPYDITATQHRIIEAGLPEPLATRLTFGF